MNARRAAVLAGVSGARMPEGVSGADARARGGSLPLSDAAPLEWRGPSRREWVARIQDGAERELLELRGA